MLLQTKLVFLFAVTVLASRTISFGQDQERSDPLEPLITYEEAFAFGLVEGVTEFLPISSTGHLILTKEFLVDLSCLGPAEQDAINAYLIVIQAGAIIAVALLYARRIIAILLGFLGFDPTGKKLGLNLICAFVPAALIGPFLDDSIEALLFGAIPVGVALILGAALMGWAEKRKKDLKAWMVIGKKPRRFILQGFIDRGVTPMRSDVSRNESIDDDDRWRIFRGFVEKAFR